MEMSECAEGRRGLASGRVRRSSADSYAIIPCLPRDAEPQAEYILADLSSILFWTE